MADYRRFHLIHLAHSPLGKIGTLCGARTDEKAEKRIAAHISQDSGGTACAGVALVPVDLDRGILG